MDLRRIFREDVKYMGRVGQRNWMDASEMEQIAAELYNVLVYMYLIDDANTKRTIVYHLKYNDQMFDGGFVSIFAVDKAKSDTVVRLFCENNKHFQWVRWDTQMDVKSELEEEATDVVDLAEEAEEAAEIDETGDIEVEVEDLEWEDGHTEAVAEVLDIRLVVTGPHDPESINGKRDGTDCIARDRERVQRVSDTIAKGKMTYPAKLGLLFYANGKPWETVVC